MVYKFTRRMYLIVLFFESVWTSISIYIYGYRQVFCFSVQSRNGSARQSRVDDKSLDEMQPSKVVDFCQALTFSGCWAGTLCVCRPIVKLIVEIFLNLWLQWLQAVWCCLYMFVSYLLMKLLAQVYTVILYTWDVLDSITWCDISLYHCINLYLW